MKISIPHARTIFEVREIDEKTFWIMDGPEVIAYCYETNIEEANQLSFELRKALTKLDNTV